MKTRGRIVVFVFFGLVAGSLLLGWGAHDRGPLARYQKQLVAAGEKLKIDELVPPSAAPGQNGADLFAQAIGAAQWQTNPPVAMAIVAPGKAMVGWAQPDVRDYATNSWSEEQEALAADGKVLNLVREAAAFPMFDFHLNYHQASPLPHLTALNYAEARLRAALLCDLHDGNAAAATTNLQVMLGLVSATAAERLVISQLIRSSMARLCFAATWEWLQSPGLSDRQLDMIQHQWADLKFVEPAEASLEMDRAITQMQVKEMRNSHARFRQLFGSTGSSSYSFAQSSDATVREVVFAAKEAQWRLAGSYPDELRALRGYQVLLESFRLVQGGQAFAAARTHQQAGLALLGLNATNVYSRLRLPNDCLSLTVSGLDKLLNRVLWAEVSRELAATAVALKRYQLRHGQYPATLSALVPEFLSAIPRDPADGQPLRYRLKPDETFSLYSVGENAIDDGGDPSPEVKSDSIRWDQGRDLVWPAVASPEEITAWQQKMLKRYRR